MIKVINGTPVLVEVKHSNLTILMVTRFGNKLYATNDGRIICTNKKDVKAALQIDRNSNVPKDVSNALFTELTINLAGGWEKVEEVHA